MKQTVLHESHAQLKAKMTDFQGWQMPLQYTDAQEEYYAVRTAAGLFDISFLGRLEIAGPDAASLLQNVFTRNTSRMAEGSAHYGFICNDAGYILDDCVLLKLPDGHKNNRYLLSTNAMNSEKILLWLRDHASSSVEITDQTLTTGQIALQGPQSPYILERLVGAPFKKFRPRSVRELTIGDTNVLVSRTGYTGEHGYEFFVPEESIGALWNALMSAGTETGIMPCGLACRETLRVEMGYLLYGNDIDETHTPLEATRGGFVDFKKDFIGKDALVKQKAEGVKQKLVGFVLLDSGVPKSGGSIFSENREIGTVTSGVQSPYLRKGIGLGYVITRYDQPGQEIEIEVREREIAARIVELPFYKRK